MSSLGKFAKQAARIERQIQEVQSQLSARTVEATSGGGAVKVVAKCDNTIVSVRIDPQAINPADAQLLEDLILTATNNALAQAREIYAQEMGKVTSGFRVPGLM
jgi:DNA-binding YbaB/EbfC family protein